MHVLCTRYVRGMYSSRDMCAIEPLRAVRVMWAICNNTTAMCVFCRRYVRAVYRSWYERAMYQFCTRYARAM